MKYSLNPKKGFTDNLEEFEQDLSFFKNGTISYQKLNENTEDHKNIVLKTNNNAILDLVSYIKEIYGIEPTYINKYMDEIFIHFYLDMGIKGKNKEALCKKLNFLYKTKEAAYFFYEKSIQEKIFVSEKKAFNTNLLADKLSFLNNFKDYQTVLNEVNYQEYLKTKDILITDIFDKLGIYQDGVDIMNNVHVDDGYPFETVQKRARSIEKTMEWFNENYGMDFDTSTRIEQVENQGRGIVIKEGMDFFSDNKGYYVEKDSKKTYVTDFVINLLYKISRSDGTFSHIVSLINGIDGEITKPINWIENCNKTKVTEYIQSYGNFHILSYPQAAFSAIHSIMSKSLVPLIKEINYFGMNKDQEMIVFRNGIFDLKTKIFTPRIEDEYWFNGNDGYKIVDKGGHNLEEILGNSIPNYKFEREVSNEDLLNFCKEAYGDNTGIYTFMIITGIMGYMLFAPEKLRFPILFTRGITGSGKSTFNELIMKIFGIKSALALTNTTPFTMIINLSYLSKFPIFFTEYRQKIPDIDKKVGTLRSVFDGAGDTKGRPDQTVVKYDYVGIPIIDGEEMITDGALRTRSIQKQFIRNHKIKGNFKLVIEKHNNVLENFLGTYLDKISCTQEKYMDFFQEAYNYFYEINSKSPRVIENIAIMYSGAMIYMPENEKLTLETLTELFLFQMKDFEENSTGSQIIKLIAKFLESYNSNYGAIHDIEDKENVKNSFIVVSWNAIVEYQNAKRITLTLDIDTYIEHLSSMGYDVDYYYNNVEQKNVYGVKIPYTDIPKEFLVHKIFYDANKKIKKG